VGIFIVVSLFPEQRARTLQVTWQHSPDSLPLCPLFVTGAGAHLQPVVRPSPRMGGSRSSCSGRLPSCSDGVMHLTHVDLPLWVSINPGCVTHQDPDNGNLIAASMEVYLLES
jgi:hypothetical protein